jgi:deoxyribodipyrimidine photo-lyase
LLFVIWPKAKLRPYIDIHNPSGTVADKLGYPRPIIMHDEARKRALRRYKNPGST